jgi:hypothetical protein
MTKTHFIPFLHNVEMTFLEGEGGQQPLVPLLLFGPPFFPIILFGSTTLLTGMAGISLQTLKCFFSGDCDYERIVFLIACPSKVCLHNLIVRRFSSCEKNTCVDVSLRLPDQCYKQFKNIFVANAFIFPFQYTNNAF